GGGGDVRERLTDVMGLGRALAVTGRLDRARSLRAEALAAAAEAGDPALAADVLSAFAVPALWPRNDDEALSRRIVRAAEDALAALPEERPEPGGERRSRLLSTLALELRGTADGRGERAARAAEDAARRADSPGALALALNARFMHTFQRPGLAAERARLGAGLVGLAARHELVTFEVLGHLVCLQARCALADFAAADAHAKSADRLAERYELPLVGVFTQWYGALRTAVAGRRAEAEAAYRAAHARLAGSGMPGMAEGLLPLALLSLRLDAGELDADELRAWPWGPYEPWVRPLVLLAEGRGAAAAAALRELPPSPRDALYEARLCLAARAAVTLGDRGTMRELHAELLPAGGELAGAGSGAVSFGPVADQLAALVPPG
ncbi:SARP family transcriptional regulator, partial [Streptomyces sp. SB3404]|nr:SARP family transcriptional regulator [Streptomyces boncukensis]